MQMRACTVELVAASTPVDLEPRPQRNCNGREGGRRRWEYPNVSRGDAHQRQATQPGSIDTRREFSYSLNCNEIFNNTGTFGSWHDSQISRARFGASTLVLIEETDTDTFAVTDSDIDNYSQSTTPTQPRHGISAFLFADGHAEGARFFDATKMTYYTDKMSGWE